MGCIQSYFRKAATGSVQASPTDIVKHVVEQELSKPEPEPSQVPIVPQEELSPLNDDVEDPDSENADRISLHWVEATAVRTLAATTGSVAILGTTAKCNENIDYRRSMHSEQAFVMDGQDESVAAQKDEQEISEKNLKKDIEVTTPNLTLSESPNIVTTAIVEVPLTNGQINIENNINLSAVVEDEKMNTVQETDDRVNFVQTVEQSTEKITNLNQKSEKDYLPKVVQSIEKCIKKDNAESSTNILVNQQSPESEISNLDDQNVDMLEVDIVGEKELSDEKTNGNSERESTSSEVISVMKENKEVVSLAEKRASFESSRPNRLSLGQHSVESEQNTLEISSADDVVKNESIDLTSPESLKESIDECVTRGIIVKAKSQLKDEGESSKEENAKEISNTSLNTLGNDSEEDGSDLEADASSKKPENVMKRFDTISSNGESSYKVEELNYPSVTEEPELEEYATYQKFNLESTFEEVFNDDKSNPLEENIRQSAKEEVNKICDQAIEKMADILMAGKAVAEETKDVEEINNVSESSVLSALDSVVAEKGSDIDSLSFLDEQNDSRSVSVLGDDSKSCRSETIYEIPTNVSSPQEDVQRRLQEWEQTSTLVTEEDASVSSQDIYEAVITQEDRSLTDTEKVAVDSISEDLPKPPNLDDFPPLPENLDQYDITEDELKAVQLPETRQENTDNENRNDSPKVSTIPVEVAASKIQAGVRGYLTRKQIKDLKNQNQKIVNNKESGEADTFDISCTKNYNKSKRLSLDSKLGDFENVRKLPKLKNTLSECVEEEGEYTDLDRAAIKIQSTFRHYRARKSICFGNYTADKLLNGDSAKSAVTVTRLAEDNRNTDSELDNDKLVDMKMKILENDLQPLIEGNF